MSSPGTIALVGSGEYLPILQDFEASLLKSGRSNKYIQIPTAAGRESDERLQYWEKLGREQAARLGAEQIFLPIYSREDAHRADFVQSIDSAGLIYFSGGDPHFLAEILIGTPVFDAIVHNWRAGSSLAGCSAGAMALGPDIPHFRKMKAEGSPGFGLLPHIRVIPHYDKFFKWIPDAAAKLFLKAPEGVRIVGIDENTAVKSSDLKNWEVCGIGGVHILQSDSAHSYRSGETFTL